MIVITKVFMIAASSLGKQLGIGKLIAHLLQKVRRK
jgi:hypothetical protein